MSNIIETLLNFVFATQVVANAFSTSLSTIPGPDMHIEEVNMLSIQGGEL